MSLVQHVSAVEGVDREPLPAVFDDDNLSHLSLTLSRVPSRRRQTSISYDPTLAVGPDDRDVKRKAPRAAYRVPAAKRLTQIVVGVISCVTGSGIVFGFAALKQVLIQENAYRNLCSEEELGDAVVVCYKQDLKLNFTFNLASVTTNVSSLLVGALLDRYGPRLCGVLGSLFIFLGSLCMAWQRELAFDAIVAGHFLLALGGTFIFVPSFHLANAFPRYQGLILALVTGAFDASAAVFLAFRILYDWTEQRFGLKQFFLLYLVVPLFIFVTQMLVMPGKVYETRGELQEGQEKAEDPTQDVHSSDDELDDREMWRERFRRADDRKLIRNEVKALLGSATEQNEHELEQAERHVAWQGWGALHGRPVLQQMRSPWFILITIFTILQMARMNLFIATVWSQYRYMLRSAELADRINDAFDVILPVAGVATVPFIGTLLDRLSIANVQRIVVALSVAIGLLNTLPFLWAGYTTVFLFCAFRPLYYSSMSDFAVKVFGVATFGTIYGTIICISGLLSFTQTALQRLSHARFSDDPTPVNAALGALTAASGLALVAYVSVAGRRVATAVLDETDEARSRLHTPRGTPRLAPASLRSPRLEPAAYGSVVGLARERPAMARPSLANLRALSAVGEERAPLRLPGLGE